MKRFKQLFSLATVALMSITNAQEIISLKEAVNFALENKSDALVIKMKQIVPEFISLNSKFEKFDN